MSSSIRSERKGSTRSADLPPPRAPAPSRVSVLSSVVPYLRRSDPDDMSAHHKSALVTLKLSSPSFLDSVVKDDASPHPLYVIRTTGTSTSVLRADPWDALTKTAEIKWPKVIPTKGKTKETLGVLVQMSDGRWQSADTVLKPGTMLSAPPKFTIPNFPHTMKWKRVGSSYWCMTSTVKGPVATFHPAVEGVPPRINVFETLNDKYDTRPMVVHNGVSLILIDHLIVTAMLLVTDVQDWMLVPKHEGSSRDVAPILPSISPASSGLFDGAPQSAPASASQWRKILYGEPIFPKRYPNSLAASTTDLSSPLPTSAKQMAKIVYGDPIYPSLTSSPVTSLWDSDDEDEDEEEEIEAWRAQRSSYNASLASPLSPPTRSHSPSADSVLYPNGRTPPPSHTYMDPTYYAEDVPPVPRIPVQYASSSVSTSSRGTTPPHSARSRAPRELPTPPAHRSQSTPPREIPVQPYGRRPSEPLFLATAASSSAPAPPRLLTRSHSMKLRQLPTPPTPTGDGPPELQRTGTGRSARRTSQYSQRSLPVPPGSAAPPPLPRPPQRKDPADELWMYSWTAAAGVPASQFEAPPPYAVSVESPTSMRSMASFQTAPPAPYPQP
ncbi:hypothetical protein B0H17DRAFT_1232666 [Mycena rosella]|uniref:Uncharacterized protein n=1 Tax=Mycena rosella TaxID=1033263 RepID=A0AAD7F7Z3_MYCRO|nr:hypothetical protein B0H17DRAFT_1232666 [Mycena rosella]